MTTDTNKKSPKAPVWVWLTILGVLIVGSALLDWMFLSDKGENTDLTSSNAESEGYSELYVDASELSSGNTLDSVVAPSTPVGSQDHAVIESSKPSPKTPWIALIIDDFGPSGTYNILPYFLDLPIEFTASVIPGNPKSAECGRLISKNRELFMHLPMEPQKPIAMDEQYMLLTSFSEPHLKSMLDKISTELPTAIGLNNHMGSKATLDKELMTMLAVELKKRNLMFYDSWTVGGTIAHKTMSSHGVLSIKRDVFLDNTRDIDLIDVQFKELVRIAKKRGYAVATAHCNRITLQYLQQNLPMEGIRFVTIQTLAQAVQRR